MNDELDPSLVFGAALAGQLQSIESTIADRETSEATRVAHATIRKAKAEIIRAAQNRSAASKSGVPVRTPAHFHSTPADISDIPPNLDSIDNIEPLDISKLEIMQGVPQSTPPPQARRITPAQPTQQPSTRDDSQMVFEFEKKGSDALLAEIENVYYAVKKADENTANKLNKIIELLEQLNTNILIQIEETKKQK